MSDINNKVKIATKWSAITEIVAKVVTPITGMVLAHLLAPEAYGVVATLAMIITFAEIFTDAGFQKYIVQHEFVDHIDLEQSTNVAFWSNFSLSLIIWGIIALFADPLARIVGSPGLGHVLIISCASIPLAAFSSIQMARYRRDFDFKTLFKVRIISILVPLLVNIPLAVWLRSYWALVIGTIAQNLINAVMLTVLSRWKPRLYFSWSKLREMLSFTIWSLVEAISIWLTGYFDVFIVGSQLSQYYLGLYKTSTTLVGQIMGLITAATTPVLFSSLSRLQNDDKEFKKLFFTFQKLVGLLVLPIGVGIFCFGDFLTSIALGNKWMEASGFIGIWGLTSAITIVLSHYASEVYRAKGRPKLSVLSQWLHIIVLWPVVLITVKYGFETLYIARSLVRFEGIIVNLILIYYLVRITPSQMIRNIWPSLLASVMIFIVAEIMKTQGDKIGWTIATMIVCCIVYFGIVLLFPTERKLLKRFILKK